MTGTAEAQSDDASDLVQRGSRALSAFAHADLEQVRECCSPDIEVVGTDPGEHWSNLESFATALEGMRELELDAHWKAPPLEGDDWLSGVALYTAHGSNPIETRVTMVFDGDLLVHAHFSIATAMIEDA